MPRIAGAGAGAPAAGKHELVATYARENVRCRHASYSVLQSLWMPILLVLFGLLAPRVTLLIAGCAGAFNTVWQTWLLPVLGFLFMPYTTLAYGIAVAYGGGVQGIWLALVIVAVLFDLGFS